MSWICIFIIIGLCSIWLAKVVRFYDLHSIVVRKDYQTVWNYLSDPLRYNKLYPFWVKNISLSANNKFVVDDQFGHTYEILLLANKENGVIDLQIGNEISSLRLFKLDEHSSLVVHVGKRWSGISLYGWVLHKRTLRKDFCNAKKIIEKS